MTDKLSSRKTIVNFSVSLIEAVEKFGLDKLTSFLSSLTPFESVITNESNSNVIISIICARYEISYEDIINKKKSNGLYLDAICLISYCLKRYSGCNPKEISVILQRHKSQISKYLSRVNSLRDGISMQDDKLIKLKDEIETQIKKQIEWKRK